MEKEKQELIRIRAIELALGMGLPDHEKVLKAARAFESYIAENDSKE